MTHEELKMALGAVTGGLLILSMVFSDVRKIKYTILSYSLWDMGVSVWLGAWPLVGMYTVKITLVAEYLISGRWRRLVKKSVYLAIAAVVAWMGYDLYRNFTYVSIVGWIHTWVALSAIAATTEKTIKGLTAIACVIGVHYGILIGYWPMSIIRVALLLVIFVSFWRMKK